MVRAVHLVVAIHTILAQQVLRWHACWQASLVLWKTWVTGLRVAALAQHWAAHTQHAGMVRAVWVVTRRTVLGHRRMLPQVRASYLRVAIVASLVYALSDQQQLSRIAMRIVATTASHVAMLYRMSVWLQRFGALLLMTIETHFSLARRLQNGITWCVTDMAVGTGDLIIVVRTRMPAKADIGVMTAETHIVLCGNWCCVVGSE